MAKQGRSLRERFDDMTCPEPNTGCLLWMGSYGSHGYGQFAMPKGRGPVPAHRVAWEIENGPLPKGAHVLHRCDVKGCVNVSHLFLGTWSDNAKDRAKKGRGTKSRRGLPFGVTYMADKYPLHPYAARVKFERKQYSLGYFATAEEAHAVAVAFKKKLYAGV